jgi:hypothetical protein
MEGNRIGTYVAADRDTGWASQCLNEFELFKSLINMVRFDKFLPMVRPFEHANSQAKLFCVLNRS